MSESGQKKTDATYPVEAPSGEPKEDALIVVLADPDTREVLLHVPKPAEGILAPVLENGRSILRFEGASPAQLAYHRFWSDGTRERFDDLVRNGRGAGVRQTVRWLLSLRIAETIRATGYRYGLRVTADRSEWALLTKAATS